MRFIFLVIGNILALFLASRYIQGVTVADGFKSILIIGLVLAVVNFILKPVIEFILGPFIILTFGILLIIINMAMLWLTDFFLPGLSIEGLGALFLTTLFVSIINIFLHIFRKTTEIIH